MPELHALRRSVPGRALARLRRAWSGSERSLRAERDALAAECRELSRQLALERRFVPAGHFYSPIPDGVEVARDAARIFAVPRTLPGIDLREAEQLALLEHIAAAYGEMPWGPAPRDGLRFGFENGAFSYGDAVYLFGMLRHVRPRRVIEVGSGHSSALMLDTDERFGLGLAATFIEPYPDVLHGLLRPGDAARITVVPRRVQEVETALFRTLDADDILFIDSTHVGKAGSDVNYLLHEVLPILRPGVLVHVHDVFYPFEYLRNWIEDGRAWNEAYMLRCFLQHNDAFRVELWNSFLLKFHEDLIRARMPLCLKNPGAGLWLRRV